jgi:hypothetical protein
MKAKMKGPMMKPKDMMTKPMMTAKQMDKQMGQGGKKKAKRKK